MRTCLTLLFSCVAIITPWLVNAQVPDSIYRKNIHTVRFHLAGDQFTMPILTVGGPEQAELHFDDLDGGVKSYYYTYQLCNSDWTPVNLSQFDYLKGFTQMRVTNYRLSSIAYTRYTHYQATLPERSCAPSRSGNYLLKVFLDGDTSKLAFTKRVLVLESKATIKAAVIQPFAPKYFRTHQKIQFNVNLAGINTFNANREIKVVILQNNRWDNAVTGLTPAFIRGTTLEYNTEDNSVFPGGKEWRWLDVRDFRLQSDRVKNAYYKKSSTEIYLRPDADRSNDRYLYYRDLNGMYSVETTQSGLNPYWQGDYATVHFSYLPPSGRPFGDKDLYLFGQLTNYNFNDSMKMVYNPETSMYETKLFMKQGYYNYTYIAADKNNFASRYDTDGNYNETENSYTILVYYRSFTGRADELIGVARLNSRTDRAMFGY